MKARTIAPGQSTFTLAVLILVLVLAAVSACGGDEKKPTKGDVTVYVAAPLSGFQANGGQTVAGGARSDSGSEPH